MYLPRYCLSKHVLNYFVFLLKNVRQILTDIFKNKSIIEVINPCCLLIDLEFLEYNMWDNFYPSRSEKSVMIILYLLLT